MNSLNGDEIKSVTDFRRDGSLMTRKVREYLPAMMLTNLSNLLLVSVDSLVVGNFVSKEALASVNIFGPAVSMIGAFTILIALGISTTISTAIGSNSQNNIDRARAASFRLMIAAAVVISIIQIPFVAWIINSYNLDGGVKALTWQYAMGIMVCSPLGLISTVGVYEMQIAGKMKWLMRLAVVEGISNLIFDLLFVAVIGMGVLGAGIGTACSNLLRCALTLWYLSTGTDMYKRKGIRTDADDYKSILRCGAPDACYTAMLAIQAYFIMKIFLSVFGSDGGVIDGVCGFCFNITFVIISGIQGSMRPLVGLLAGADDRKGLSTLMNTGFRLNAISTGVFTLVVLLFPAFFYHLHGVDDIPEGGLLSLRFYSLYFVIKGCNILIRMYLANRRDSEFATRLTIAGCALMLAIAFTLSKTAPPPYVWLAYLINESAVFAVLYSRFKWWKNKDKKEDYQEGSHVVLYMTVEPEEAVEASRALRKFAKERGINPYISNRVGLCMEEMVMYANAVNEKADRSGGFAVQVMVRFRGSDAATFTCLDDGDTIKLDADEKTRKITTNNYELLRRVAKSVDYQYILDMNYTTIKIEL